MIETANIDKTARKCLEQRSSCVFQHTPVCSGRRRTLDETGSPRRSSLCRPVLAATKAKDLLDLIARIDIDSPSESCPLLVVSMQIDDEVSSDISSSDVEDDENSHDNNFGMKANADPSFKKYVAADLPGLDMVGLKEKFCNEAWYALD